MVHDVSSLQGDFKSTFGFFVKCRHPGSDLAVPKQLFLPQGKFMGHVWAFCPGRLARVSKYHLPIVYMLIGPIILDKGEET